MEKKRIYTFGNGHAEGKADMRNLLGGKGANLAEMNLIGVPVPPGFTITTEVCNEYFEKGKDDVVALLKNDVEKSIAGVEELMKSKFGDVENPLLVSVRSGARASMPGMMDTILNLGLNDKVVVGLAKKTGNERFAWDSYRRFIQMYGDVVLGMKPTNKEDIDPFEAIIEDVKKAKELHPEAVVLAHPECTGDVLELADFVGSTSQIIDYATNSDEKVFLICTEMGVFYELLQKNPEKKFFSVGHRQFCPNMKKIHLDSVLRALENPEEEVEMDEAMRQRAVGPLARMLELAK